MLDNDIPHLGSKSIIFHDTMIGFFGKSGTDKSYFLLDTEGGYKPNEMIVFMGISKTPKTKLN